MRTEEIQEIYQKKIKFPFSLYIQQLFATNIYVKFFNPFAFWRRYRINHLETCWEINIVQQLENCQKIESKSIRSNRENKAIANSFQTGIYRSVSWEKIAQNTILISQPSFELKYRGVSYCNSGIAAVNTNKFQVNWSQISLDASHKSFTLNNSINSAISSTFWKLK